MIAERDSQQFNTWSWRWPNAEDCGGKPGAHSHLRVVFSTRLPFEPGIWFLPRLPAARSADGFLRVPAANDAELRSRQLVAAVLLGGAGYGSSSLLCFTKRHAAVPAAEERFKQGAATNRFIKLAPEQL